MRTFKLDANNDLCLVCDTGLRLIDGKEAMAQSATNYARTLRGEMMHKKRSGVRYFDTVIGTNPTRPAILEHDMKERLLEVPGVNRISSFAYSQVGEEFRYSATLETDSGMVQVNG